MPLKLLLLRNVEAKYFKESACNLENFTNLLVTSIKN